MMRVKSPKSKAPQRGFTLLEVLVAIVVLALGLLGLAALQMNGLQSAHSSYQRSVATLSAQDAAERLWGYLLSSETFYALENLSDRSILCPDASQIENKIEPAWKADWGISGGGSEKLAWKSGESAITLDSTCKYTVTLAWIENRFGAEEVSVLRYKVALPAE